MIAALMPHIEITLMEHQCASSLCLKIRERLLGSAASIPVIHKVNRQAWHPWALQVKQERVRKGKTFREFREEVARELGIEPSKQRFWTFAKRQNNTMRCADC